MLGGLVRMFEKSGACETLGSCIISCLLLHPMLVLSSKDLSPVTRGADVSLPSFVGPG